MMKRPKTVPEDAVFNADENQWELGKRNAAGKPDGLWKFWWATTGHHCCDTVYSKNGTVETFTRYHPDGTYSRKGMTVGNRDVGLTQYQKSKSKTTELAISEKLYANVFSVTHDNDAKGEALNWKYYDAKVVRVDLDGEPLMTDAELSKNFGDLEPPKELVELLEFQNLWGIENFSQGFAIVVDDKSLIETWSRDKAFLKAFMPFASANGTGSCYALWNRAGTSDASKMPVVIFGDEGGCHVIAENVRGLLEILSADSEPSVTHDGVDFYGNDDASERIKQFRKWLKDTFQIAAVKNPGKVVKAAQAKLAKPFGAWMEKYAKT